jgi:endoglycosylceramidase
MYQRLTDAIRTVDAESWIFVHPPNVASLGVRTHLGPIDDPKVAFYPHLYDTGLESGGAYDPASTFLASWEGVISAYPEANGVPMLVGEWGLPDPAVGNGGAYVDGALGVLERTSSGWTVFSWCAGAGYCVLDDAGQLDPVWRKLVQAWPRAVAGAPTASHWDGDERSLRVTYRDRAGTTGPTEIVVPPGLYPEGFVVQTSAADGTWSWTHDEATGRLRVTMPTVGGDRAICVRAVADPAGCPLDAAPGEEPPAAGPAVPVAGEARFTG